MRIYPASGEINSKLTDPTSAIARVRAEYEVKAIAIDETDGISMEFDGWRLIYAVQILNLLFGLMWSHITIRH